MIPQQWPDQPPRPPGSPGRRPLDPTTAPHRSPVPIDWKCWARGIERKRKALDRLGAGNGNGRHGVWRFYLARVTRASFQLDGIDLPERAAADALAVGAAGRVCRSRQGQRLRNHVAILRRIGGMVRHGQPLSGGAVVRWYTSISCGLSSARLDGESLARLERVARQINSPHLNLRPAVEETARLYYEILADPIVPSFNGILARLLLGCQLGRCGLPPVLFDPASDRALPADPAALLRRLLELVQKSYDCLLGTE
jgi:hypothetical protein